MMKKLIASLLLCSVLFLCACGAPAEPTTDATTAPTTEATEPTEVLQIVSGIPVPWETPAPEKPDFSAIDELTPNADGVYQIHSKAGVVNMAQHPDGKFQLLWDVDMEGESWTPIASFTGSIDGGEYTISNFTVAQADCAGFVGINEGTIENLKLDGVTLAASSGLLGGIAGENRGTIRKCTVGGTMAVSADAVAGGLVGKMETGVLEGSNCALQITADENTKVGLLGGALRNVTVTGCRYTGAVNTKGSALFTDLAATAQGVTYTDCLYRDNTHSDAFLSEKSLEMRAKVVEKMRAMGTVKWIPQENLMYVHPSTTSGNRLYVKGMVYHGLPYTANFGSYERFLYSLNEDGTLKDFVINMGTQGADIFDMYMGNDCSGAVYWAWTQFSNSTEWIATQGMIPSQLQGGVMIGQYDCEGLADTMQILDRNGRETIAEAYTHLNMGDAVVTYFNDPKNASHHLNHTRMLVEAPTVLRNTDGTLNVDESFIIIHGQGDGLSEAYPSTWEIDQKYSFKELLDDQYIPVSCAELVNGEAPACVVTVDNTGTGKAYMATGTVESNYRLISTNITVTDAAGNAVFDKTIFTSVGKNSDMLVTDPLRAGVNTFDLAAYSVYLKDLELTAGESYTYTLTAMPSTGESVEVKTFTITG